MLNWDSVGNDCLPHFLNGDASETYSKLTRADSDEEDKPVQCSSHKQSRVLLLALDEARWLQETDINDQTGWFRRLRRALNLANDAIRFMYGRYAGIFAILIDTNFKISDFTPSSTTTTRDPASREPQTGDSVVFPPFVLTHTMDIILDASISAKTQEASEFYSKFVQMNTDGMRDGLVDMGRPLWQRYKVANAKEQTILSQAAREDSRNAEWMQLLRMAAEKLVGGQSLSKVAEGDSSTLGGVAALLCRVGIRPYSWSPLASRMVANHMAILSHVNFTQDQFVCSYSSDPILTFGAAAVWYENVKLKIADSTSYLDCHLLEHRILPELRKMLHQELLDICDTGELVARIMLLLAMDATGVVTTGNEAERCYAGKFYSVSTFLKTLSGDSTEVFVGVNDPRALSVDDLLEPWESWSVGFSHFVQLSTEPSEELLWAMLARRVACALPCDCDGVDLLIPIFKGSEVSMILVQVKNGQDGDSDYPDSSALDTRPSHVFSGELRSMKNEDVLRVYMSLRGFESLQQCFLVDPDIQRSPRLPEFRPSRPSTVASSAAVAEVGASVQGTKPDSTVAANEQTENSTTSPNKEITNYPFVLCLRGLNGWHARRSNSDQVCVVSQSVADQLKSLLPVWKKLEALVETDMDTHGARFGKEPSEVMEIAVRPLVETVLLDKWERIRRSVSEASDKADGLDEFEGRKKRRKLTPQKALMAIETNDKERVAPVSDEDDEDNEEEGVTQ